MALIRHMLDTEDIVFHIGDEFNGLLIVSREVFNLPYMYFLMHEWLIEHEYCPRTDWDFGEKYFMERDLGGTAGKEIRVRWRCEKQSRDKLFTFKLDINWWVLGLKETEVVVKGKKIKANTGEVEIKIWPRMIISPAFFQGRGELFKGFVKNVLIKRLIRKKVLSIRKDLYEEAYQLQEALKTYLKIETYLEDPQLKKFYKLRTGE